jgi:hypothetical protein
VYEEFVESFKADEGGAGGGDSGGVKAFVRGGVVAPGSRAHDAVGALSWLAAAGAVGGWAVPCGWTQARVGAQAAAGAHTQRQPRWVAAAATDACVRGHG